MADFMDVIHKWCDQTENTLDEVLQTIVIKIGTSLVRLSPVDTGRFKGNWQLTIDSRAESSLNRFDKEGGATLTEITKKANTFTAGQIAYIQNHVLYGYDLEYGSSAQARNPDGMLRITAARFSQIVDEAVSLHT